MIGGTLFELGLYCISFITMRAYTSMNIDTVLAIKRNHNRYHLDVVESKLLME
jgi:hypothetical protein